MSAPILDLLETVQAADASASRLFGGEGTGMAAVRQRADADYQKNLAEVAGLMAAVIRGRKPAYLLQEAMSTSDFPLYMGDLFDRSVLANYRTWEKQWPKYLTRKTVRDFRTANLFAFDGGQGALEVVPELTEYPAASRVESKYTLAVKKYGRRFPFSWELMINDDLDAFKDSPAWLGAAAARSEDRYATDLYLDSSGPDATFVSAGNGNLITGNPALTTTALQVAITQLTQQTDEDGEPIMFESFALVVPPALAITAANIKNTTEYRIVVGSNTQVVSGNAIGGNFEIVVNPYIPVIATSNGATTWMLFGNPAGGRPGAAMAFLRGHEDPEIFVKESNQRRVGGGLNPMDGDFETDSIEYKLRHCFGGSLLDPKTVVGSDGSGS